MPQAPKKDISAQKAQDKESKRARGALSCAECRRLKLKCDKTVPCSSCKRRGCSAICPNGSLITGQGTRFVLADTEQLHSKISIMSDRIRQLEDALAVLHSTIAGHGAEPHPLLDREQLRIKSSIDLHAASDGLPSLGNGGKLDPLAEDEGEGSDREQYIDAFGTLAIRDDGAATFYGRSAGSESLLMGEAAADLDSPASNQRRGSSEPCPQFPQGNSLAAGVAELATSFPLAPSLSFQASSGSSFSGVSGMSNSTQYSALYSPLQVTKVTLNSLVSNFLPTHAEAVRLTQLYLEQAPWFFGPVTKQQIEEELLPLWYEGAAPTMSPTSVVGPNRSTPPSQRTGTSHDLALLFVLCCFGHMTDVNLPAPPDNVASEQFYQLAKAALTLDPNASPSGNDSKPSRNGILDRPPSVATVQTLSLMAIYEGICSGENSIESTWALMGLAGKLSQSIGLHRDAARWKLSPAEVQKRRALFWEIFITDCWQSLATGRLATFSLPFVDCELPFDADQTIAADGSPQPSFPYWKARFGAECVAAVVQGTLTSRAPKYSIILELDRRIRDMELPQYAQGPPPQGLGLAQTMSHFMPHNYRELTLLYIHRCFFAHAVTTSPLDPIKSQYAPSFLAGYRSACTILASIRAQFAMFPAHIARFWVLWTHGFSATVMLASVATHASRSKIAPAALLELKNACDLFEAAHPFGGRAGKFLPILRRLQFKAQQAYREANSGLPPPIPNDIFKPSNPDEPQDELSIFSGKTHKITTKSATANPNSPSETGTNNGDSRSSSKQPRAASDSPPQTYSDNPHFAGVHPSLVSELDIFHGQIKAQLQSAYRAGSDVFGPGPMAVDAPIPQPIRAAPASSQPQLQHQSLQALQQQQQRQYERQELERFERSREAADRRESERVERERVDMERQREARRQQQQMDAQHREQLELQMQREALQRQQQQVEQEQHQRQLELERERVRQQKEYHHQMGMQQRQMQQQQPLVQQPQYSTATPAYVPEQPNMTITANSQAFNPSRRPSMQELMPKQQPPPPLGQSHHHGIQRHASFEHHRPHHQAPAPPPIAAPLITPQHTGSNQPYAPQSSQPHPPPSVQVSHQHQHHHQHIHLPPQQPQHAAYQDAARVGNNVHYQPPPPMSGQPLSSTSSYGSIHAQPSPPTGVAVSAPQPPMSHTAPPSQMHGAPSHHLHPHSNGISAAPGPSTGHASFSTLAQESYKYWPAAASSFSVPGPVQQQDQLNASGHLQPQPGGQPYSAYGNYPHPQYTPEGALRGIAADDPRLQETWQSYMNSVGSPRQIFGD